MHSDMEKGNYFPPLDFNSSFEYAVRSNHMSQKGL